VIGVSTLPSSARARIAALSLLLSASPLVAQTTEASRPWMLSAGALAYRVSELNGWGFGPAAGARRRLHRSVHLDLNAGALLSSSGFYDFGGVTLDAGPALLFSGSSLEAGVGAGIASVVGGDSDGTGGGWIGGYLSGQGTAWLAPRMGLTLRAAYREISTGRSSPSISLSLALRL
jgi:hypothetical protein